MRGSLGNTALHDPDVLTGLRERRAELRALDLEGNSRTRLQERIVERGRRCDDRAMLAATRDPDGRRVVLKEEDWSHIKEGHPILASRMGDIMAAVRAPTRRLPGRTRNEEWFFTDEALPRLWLQVVVHCEGGEGWIVSAFLRESPRRR